jgi:predicted HAD superfamily phosphohydrolase YqeG
MDNERQQRIEQRVEKLQIQVEELAANPVPGEARKALAEALIMATAMADLTSSLARITTALVDLLSAQQVA